MKKLLLLIGMLLLPSINIDASVAEYCMEKYPPEKDKNKFVQCVDDVLEFTKENKEAAEANNQPASNEIYPSDNFNFLDPSAMSMNGWNQSQKNEALKIYDGFLRGKKNKAFVFSYNVNKFHVGDVYTWCTDGDSVLDATKCAIAKCEKSKSKGEICLAQYENDNYVFAKNRNIVKAKYASSNQAPIRRNSQPNYDALSSMGSCLQTEGSFAACSNAWQGYTPPKKTVTKCRYDTFGNVITGTCTTQ